MKTRIWGGLCAMGLLYTAACEVPCQTRRGDDDPSCKLGKTVTVAPSRVDRSGGALTVTHDDIDPTQKIALRIEQVQSGALKRAPLVLKPGAVQTMKVTADVTAMDLTGFVAGPARAVLSVNDRDGLAPLFIYSPPQLGKDPASMTALPDPYESTVAVKVIGRRLVVFRRAMVGPKLQTAVLTYKLGDTFELGASTPWAPELSWDGNAQFDKLGSLFLGTAVESDTRYLYLCDLDANTCQEKTAISLPISGTVVTAIATSDARSGVVLVANRAGGAMAYQAFSVNGGKFSGAVPVNGLPEIGALQSAQVMDLGAGPTALLIPTDRSKGVVALSYVPASRQFAYNAELSGRLTTAMKDVSSVNLWASGDLDQDGLADAAVNLSGLSVQVNILSNRGDQTLGTANASVSLSGPSVAALDIGDINNDGVNDIVVAGNNKSIQVFRNSAR